LKRYETIFITPPELPEEDQTALLEKVQSTLANIKADLIKLEDWGAKKLSYQIRKNSRGRYFLMDYLASPETIRELERTLRLNDRILKYLTVKIDDRLSPEAAQALKAASPEKKVLTLGEAPASAEEKKTEEKPQGTADEGGDK
jgi:small subunit ribosomal protein S6